jgi:hypothetical protein
MDKGAFVSRAEPETNRLTLMMRHPLARRFVAGVRGVGIARSRDERLQPGEGPRLFTTCQEARNRWL